MHTLQSYGIGCNEEDVFIIDDSTSTVKDVKNVQMNIMKLMKSNPETKYLITAVLAGYGFMINGEISMAVNEFDTRTAFYKMSAWESFMRKMARLFKNSYWIAFVITCRESEKQIAKAVGVAAERGSKEYLLRFKKHFAAPKEMKQATTVNQAESVQCENFFILYGCHPGGMIAMETKFESDLTRTLMNYDKSTLEISFPDILQGMQGTDCNFEIAQSITLQPLKLRFQGDHASTNKSSADNQEEKKQGR